MDTMGNDLNLKLLPIISLAAVWAAETSFGRPGRVGKRSSLTRQEKEIRKRRRKLAERSRKRNRR